MFFFFSPQDISCVKLDRGGQLQRIPCLNIEALKKLANAHSTHGTQESKIQQFGCFIHLKATERELNAMGFDFRVTFTFGLLKPKLQKQIAKTCISSLAKAQHQIAIYDAEKVDKIRKEARESLAAVNAVNARNASPATKDSSNESRSQFAWMRAQSNSVYRNAETSSSSSSASSSTATPDEVVDTARSHVKDLDFYIEQQTSVFEAWINFSMQSPESEEIICTAYNISYDEWHTYDLEDIQNLDPAKYYHYLRFTKPAFASIVEVAARKLGKFKEIVPLYYHRFTAVLSAI